MHTSHSRYCHCSMHPLPFAPLLPTCGLLHPCCLCILHTYCLFFFSYILRSVCTHFFSLVLISPCSMLHMLHATIGHLFPPNVLLFLYFHPSCCSCFPSSLQHHHHYLYTPSHPSSSCYPHHHHPHYVSSYSLPSLHFFPSPFSHSPFLLYFIIHIWHHLRLAFFCTIMVICSFCVTSDHIIILHLICDAKYVSIFLLLSLL